MEYELISITGNERFSTDRIIKVRTHPTWFERVILRKKSEEIEFIGFRRWWRRLPGLQSNPIFSDTDGILCELAERHDLRERLKTMGR